MLPEMMSDGDACVTYLGLVLSIYMQKMNIFTDDIYALKAYLIILNHLGKTRCIVPGKDDTLSYIISLLLDFLHF